MPLLVASVKLWKTREVSYLQTLSYSTSTQPQHSVDYLRKDPTNMVLESFGSEPHH